MDTSTLARNGIVVLALAVIMALGEQLAPQTMPLLFTGAGIALLIVYTASMMT